MPEKHYFEQKKHAETYLIPYLERNIPCFHDFKILDVGCAEAGFLDVLHSMKISGVGLELEPERIILSKSFNPDLDILEGDITDPAIITRIGRTFDLIVIRDVIEHITDKDAAFKNLSALLKPEGLIYITFPPRLSPFGGHQQNGRSILRRVPYLHLLPQAILNFLGNAVNEYPSIIENAITNYRIGLSIRRFKELCTAHGFRIGFKELFLFRPVFHVRYGLPPCRLPDIPGLREFFVLGCECLLQKEKTVSSR